MIPAQYKLGRLKPPPGQKRLRLSQYQKAALPTAPPAMDLTWGCIYPMLGNDTRSNCTFAAAAHLSVTQSATQGLDIEFTEDEVVSSYLEFTNGQDVGAVETQVLDRIAGSGFPTLTGTGWWKVAGYASVNVSDHQRIKDAAAAFQGLYCGVGLPLSARWQLVWEIPEGQAAVGDWAPWSWGGHAVPLVGYDDTYVTFVTWGRVMQATWRWFATYCDEAYAVLNAAREGLWGQVLNFDELQADLAALRAGGG